MNAVEIEEAVSLLVSEPFDHAEFPFQFLEAFGNKETTLKRLRKGSTNRSDVDRAVLQNRNIHILTTELGAVEAGLIALRESPKTTKQKAKFIFATDGQTISAEDLKSGETLDCDFTDLPTHFGFLLPLAGITTVSEIKNNPIDIKATGRLDKLYVALLQDERNKDWAEEKNRKRFNHFMAQLIFCFFAEDTGIFRGKDLFTQTVQQMSESDGSNTQEIITNCFAAMNLDPRKGGRKGVRPYADVFPYVNGGLFKDTGDDIAVPIFNKMARTYLLRAGDLDWTAINPDIFAYKLWGLEKEWWFPSPEKENFKKKTENKLNTQSLIMRLNTQSATDLVSAMKALAFNDENSIHMLWFDYLQSTIKYADIISGKERFEKVKADLGKQKITIRSLEVVRRIAQSRNYKELESHLPSYLERLAKGGNMTAESLLLELPEEKRPNH